MGEMKKPMMKKVGYLFSLLCQGHRKLLYVSGIQIPILVALPYLQIYLTKLIVEGIGRSYPLRNYILAVVGVLLLRLGLTVIKEWGMSVMQWDSNCLVNTLLKRVDGKTMSTDYGNVEGTAGQQCRQKAINATYQIGGNLVSRIVSFLI